MRDPIARPAQTLLNRFAALAMLVMLPALAVFGWRAAVVVGSIVCVNQLSTRVLNGPRSRGNNQTAPTIPINALLLAALLPAETASARAWLLLPCGAILLTLLARLRARWTFVPFDAAIVAVLGLHLLASLSGIALAPAAALQRHAMFTGDVLRTVDTSTDVDPWYKRARDGDEPARRSVWVATALDDYLHARVHPGEMGGTNLDALTRDRLPPLEDLVLLGHPMPLGQASGVMVIGVVLWGAYRRLIDWRVPIVAGLAAYIALIVLAIPTSISAHGNNWRFLAAARADVGPATAFTFAHYVIFASPMTLTLGLLASRLDTRPMRVNAIVVWAIVLGVATAACTLYVSVAIGPVLAIAFAPLMARWLDRMLARRPMRLPD